MCTFTSDSFLSSYRWCLKQLGKIRSILKFLYIHFVYLKSFDMSYDINVKSSWFLKLWFLTRFLNFINRFLKIFSINHSFILETIYFLYCISRFRDLKNLSSIINSIILCTGVVWALPRTNIISLPTAAKQLHQRKKGMRQVSTSFFMQ